MGLIKIHSQYQRLTFISGVVGLINNLYTCCRIASMNLEPIFFKNLWYPKKKLKVSVHFADQRIPSANVRLLRYILTYVMVF